MFSSGNDPGGNGDPVSYPATLGNVIAVGATSMCDERKTTSSCDGENWGSNYGSELDVVAPGVNIYTTDISGADGYENGDYDPDFNGTSSACPNVAAVAALVLSINPDFLQAQVRECIEKSTEKVGGYSYSTSPFKYGGDASWNNEAGYGRVNARNAVVYARDYDLINPSLPIYGITQLTPGYQTTYRTHNPYATRFEWIIPSGCSSGYCWNIISGQGTSQIRISAGSIGSHNIICKIYAVNDLIDTRYITVNVQITIGGSGGGSGGDPCVGNPIVLPTVIYPPEPCDPDNFSTNSAVSVIEFERTIIYNSSGQILIDTDSQEVDLSSLLSGLYILNIQLSDGRDIRQKIVR